MSWEFASPLTLLREWADRPDQADLHDLVLLGFTVDLPFLEKTVISAARALSARITIVGDAAQGLYDPVDVRMAGRAYFHGLAMCRGAFHPKLALLVGEHDIVAAIGSGNPTMAGWGYNKELWTVFRGGRGNAPAGVGGLGGLGAWLGLVPEHVRMPEYVGELLREVSGSLDVPPTGENTAGGDTTGGAVTGDGAPDQVRVLHNLRHGLLSQLPAGPVDELCLYAPFLDPSGAALSRIVEHFDPGEITLGVQERWTSYDGDAILKALSGRRASLRLLPEDRPRHGKLLEWRTGDARSTLTGSANLTQSALLRSTSEGGNCELAVLAPAPGDRSLMPAGTDVAPARLQALRTVRPVEGRPTLFVLGALLTGKGLTITLARAYDVDVIVEVSPDGSPGSWLVIGTVPAGVTVKDFAVPELAGAVVRVVDPRSAQGRTESPPVFVAHPVRCARRQDDAGRPRLRHAYTEEEIFTDEELARRFRHDLLRLSAQLMEQKSTRAAAVSRPATSSTVHDRWAAYIDDCARSIGRPMTIKIFGRVGVPGPVVSIRWGLTDSGTIEDTDESATDDSGDDQAGPTEMRLQERLAWRRWAFQAVDRTVPSSGPPAPMMIRILVGRIFVQLLGHGVWDLDDESWRESLARLTTHLVPEPADDLPEESLQHVAALAAVCMGLLRSGASLTGGGPEDLPAVRTWPRVKSFVAGAEREPTEELLIPPRLPRARVLDRSEWEDLVRLAADDDPAAHIAADLAEHGWELDFDGDLHRVTGSFTNPIPVAAQVATLLGAYQNITVVQARAANGSWAFVAWRRPDLVLLSAPGNLWRLYRLTGLATPASRLAGGDGLTSVGLVGRPARFGTVPHPTIIKLLEDAGLDHLSLHQMLIG